MKILYFFGDDGTYMSRWQLDHFIDELSRHSVEFELFNPLSYSCFDEANEQLIRRLKTGHNVDCFMNGAPCTQLYKETMVEIRKLNIPKLLICFDNLHAPYMHKEIMPLFDLVWLTSKENETKIKSWGANTIFLPYAANPYKFTMVNTTEDVHKVCFIGSPYGTRCLKLNYLLKCGIPCDIYYGGKKKNNFTNKAKRDFDEEVIKMKNYLLSSIGRKLLFSNLLAKVKKTELINESEYLQMYDSLDFSDMTRKYHEYALSLNITEVWNSYLLKHPVYKLHLRTFEIPMCGGVEFTSYNEEIADYFEEGKEIVFYRSEEEYIDKARFYLDENRKSLCDEIKIAARKRAEKDHTWWNRFSVVFERLGIK